MLSLIHLYTNQDEEYFYDCETKAFCKGGGDLRATIEPSSLPLGVRRPGEGKPLAVVHRLGYSSIKPIPGVPQLHYCYDVDQEEYLLKILPPHRQGDSLENEDANLLVVLPEGSVPEDAVQECKRLNRIKKDIEGGVLYRELLGHF